MTSYEQTARPGHIAPHAWLDQGRSTLDLFGRGFVLLRLGDDPPDARALAGAARAVRMPLNIVDIPNPDIAALYRNRLVLVRPDGMVCWRADLAPSVTESVIEVVTGA